MATGHVLNDTKARHSSKEVLAFFKYIDLHVAKDLEIHVVLDNLSAHKAEPVATWLAHPKRARWHLHFAPTSSSWLNFVESWFSQLTSGRLKKGTCSSGGPEAKKRLASGRRAGTKIRNRSSGRSPPTRSVPRAGGAETKA